MRPRQVRRAFAALVLNFLLALGVYGIWHRSQARFGLAANVVIATHDLQAETTIDDKDLELRSRPDSLPPGCLLNRAQVVGRRVLMPLSKGDIVCERHLSTVTADEVASIAGPSMRALWVRVVAANLPEKGTWVDVWVSGTGKRPEPLLKNVLVLAIDDRRYPLPGISPMVSVALGVLPDDAAKLITASRHLPIQLSRTKN